MVDFTYESLAEDLGTGTADGLRNLANTAANVYCDAYQAYAGAFAPSSSPIGLVRGIDAFNSRLCSPRNKRPAPPQLPFSGGQCAFRYNVSGTTTDPTNGTLPYTVIGVLGPINGIVIDNFGNNQRRFSIQGAPDPPTFPDGKRTVITSGTGFDPSLFSANITNVVRTGGGSDTCGNRDPGYPPVVAPAPSLNVPVSVNLGGFTLNANATIIAPQFEANANVEVGVNVKIGDFNVEFNAGGVNITNEFKPSIDISLPSSGTDGRQNPPTPKPINDNDGECDLTPVLDELADIEDLLEDIKKCACDEFETIAQSYPASNSLDITTPEGDIVEAFLNITEFPPNVRTQYGGGSAPDVYYIGWYSFGTAPNPKGDRMPVSYAQNSFVAPKGAKSFSYTLHQGAEGILTLVYKRNDP